MWFSLQINATTLYGVSTHFKLQELGLERAKTARHAEDFARYAACSGPETMVTRLRIPTATTRAMQGIYQFAVEAMWEL